MAKYRLLHQHRKFSGIKNWRGWHMELMQEFVEYFNKTEDEEMEIAWVDPRLQTFRSYGPGRYFEQQCIIEDVITKKYWVINYQDRQSTISARYLDMINDPLFVSGIKIMYAAEGDYGKVKPWFYFAKDPRYINQICDDARKIERTQEELFFRGYAGTGRRRQILKAIYDIDQSVLFPHTSSTTKNEYFSQLSQAKLALCIMGTAHACHREIECFAVGTPVLSRYYRNHYHEPLIPNVHYVLAECARNANDVEQAAEYIRNYKRVINNTVFLNGIAKNAAEWYDRNIRPPNSLQIMKRLLGLGLNI